MLPVPNAKVPVEISGRNLFLRYSLAALARWQEALGPGGNLRSVLQAIDKLQPRPDEDTAAWMDRLDLASLQRGIWAGLVEEDGETPAFASPQAVGAALDFFAVPNLMIKLNLAVARQFAPDVGETGGDGPPRTAAAASADLTSAV